MLTTFQLITLDYWENVYNMVSFSNFNLKEFVYVMLLFQVLASCGPASVSFFTIVVFFGSFYLINLMLAVVALSYEEEAEITLEVTLATPTAIDTNIVYNRNAKRTWLTIARTLPSASTLRS